MIQSDFWHMMEIMMAWTETARRQYERQNSRYASDLLTHFFIQLFGWCVAAFADGLSTVFHGAEILSRSRDKGTLRALNNTLVMAARELTGKQSSPSAGVIDSQSVKTTESGGIRGFDAGKKINRRKRHSVVDTLDLMVGLVIHSAGIQDRDGAPGVLKTILKRWPWLRHIFADGGYAGPKLKGRLEKAGKFTLEIGKRTDHVEGFELLPRRWVVERTFAWLGRWRKLTKDFEKTISSSEARIYIAVSASS